MMFENEGPAGPLPLERVREFRSLHLDARLFARLGRPKCLRRNFARLGETDWRQELRGIETARAAAHVATIRRELLVRRTCRDAHWNAQRRPARRIER